MRAEIKDPSDLTTNVSCEAVSDQYHEECAEKAAGLTGATKYSAYNNCMQRKAVIEGTKDYLERRREQ